MSPRFLKTIVLPALALVVAAALWAVPAKAADEGAKSLSKADVEKIIHDYIVANPQVILNAVDDYQRTGAAARAVEGMSKNKDNLQNDPASAFVGNPDGDVTVVEFFDYNCHFCKDALPTVMKLLDKDKNVRFVFKDFPILGPTSETAAKWALAANKQKKYFEFHKAMMENKTPIDDALLEKVAAGVGMNVDQAKKDIASQEILLQIEKDRTLANDIGIRGTPAFVVGDELVSGALTLESLEKKVAEQREKAKKK
jgi:protein-disulfide isomerase